jgi:uncharacterized membrane protein
MALFYYSVSFTALTLFKWLTILSDASEILSNVLDEYTKTVYEKIHSKSNAGRRYVALMFAAALAFLVYEDIIGHSSYLNWPIAITLLLALICFALTVIWQFETDFSTISADVPR